jgi:hypothetical protein
MATRPYDVVGRLAVERARARNPSLAPDSVEVVELARERPYVLVRTAPAGVVVLDQRGRLVRGRDRIARIARHGRAVAALERVQEEAQLERRLEHARESIVFIEEGVGRDDPRPVIVTLRALEGRLLAVLLDRRRGVLTTERTLRTRIELHNDAARADRSVVRATRALAGELAGARETRSAGRSALHRWIVARLGSSDLPFFHPELDASDAAVFVAELVAATRQP